MILTSTLPQHLEGFYSRSGGQVWPQFSEQKHISYILLSSITHRIYGICTYIWLVNIGHIHGSYRFCWLVHEDCWLMMLCLSSLYWGGMC